MQDRGMAPSHIRDVGGSFETGVSQTLRDTFEHRLRSEGPMAALALLNTRTRFRFTGLYRVIPPQLHNVRLYDRENPTLNVSGAVCAISDTYCAIACATDDAFTVDDAPSDARLAHHPARESVQSYAGVPVRLPDGRVLGTLCHFDGRPRILPSGELSVLRDLAPLLAPWLVDDK